MNHASPAEGLFFSSPASPSDPAALFVRLGQGRRHRHHQMTKPESEAESGSSGRSGARDIRGLGVRLVSASNTPASLGGEIEAQSTSFPVAAAWAVACRALALS